MRALPVAVLVLSACSPALDWRELRPADAGGAVATLPCRPSSHARRLPLAGREVLLTLYTCSAGDVTWAFAFADMADPALVGPALADLQRSAAANIGAPAGAPLPLAVPGATPNPAAGRVALQGRRGDGQPVVAQVAVFAKGLRVYQATALGDRLPAEGLEVFFGGLRAP